MRPVMSDATARMAASYTGDATGLVTLLLGHIHDLDRHIDAGESQAHEADLARCWPYAETSGAA